MTTPDNKIIFQKKINQTHFLNLIYAKLRAFKLLINYFNIVRFE